MTESSPAPSSDATWTVGRMLTWTTNFFTEKQVDAPRLSAEVLLAHAAGCKRLDLYVRFHDVLPQNVIDVYRGLVRRAAEHEPVAYLVGTREFFSLPFEVGPDVLIPRPETEGLVECAIEIIQQRAWSNPCILDVGTGSGCITIALLHNVAHCRAVASDISESALAVAKRNGDKHLVSDRVTFVAADGMNLPAAVVPAGGFQLVLSNPPYIARQELPRLAPGVVRFEPMVALSDQDDGLSLFRAVAQDAGRMLADDGVVIVEIGAGQVEAVLEIFSTCGFTHQRTLRDRVVGHERIVIFDRQPAVESTRGELLRHVEEDPAAANDVRD